MEIEGTVHNGVVILETESSLPDGTRVTVTPLEEDRKDTASAGKRLLWLAGAIQEMPADFAEEHDHYIHGTPRRNPSGEP